MLGRVRVCRGDGTGIERLWVRIRRCGLGCRVGDGMTRRQERNGDGETSRLMLSRLGVQLGLRHRYVGADARDARLFLHAMLMKRGSVSMDADGDALEAGHRE